MTLHGKIQNGVVILDGGVKLPDGTEVAVFVAGPTAGGSAAAAGSEDNSDAERKRVVALVDRIASLPDENPTDTFSGADHDQVLYGAP